MRNSWVLNSERLALGPVLLAAVSFDLSNEPMRQRLLPHCRDQATEAQMCSVPSQEVGRAGIQASLSASRAECVLGMAKGPRVSGGLERR